MPECFAASLGGCGGGPSLEHFVSAAVLKQVNASPLVEGWPGIAAVKRVGVGALGSKILCRVHNEFLSPLDTEAMNIFGAIREFDADLADPLKPVTASTVEAHGSRLELWLLKVALGLAAVHTRAGDLTKVRDHERLLKLLFGLEGWPDGWGLYVPGALDDQYLAPADVAVQSRNNPLTGEIWQIVAWARFLPLLLCLGVPAGDLHHRPGAIHMDRVGSNARKTLELRWNDEVPRDFVAFTRIGSVDAWGQLPS